MNFEEYVENLKRKLSYNKKEILFVCIGTSKVLWDSIGPLVGSYLKQKINKKQVLGDINKNICSKWDLIYNYHKFRNKFIIAIDTAVVSKKYSEQIFISNMPLTMGLAVNKNKGIIGNISIKIAISDFKLVNYEYVNYISEFIGRGICEAINGDVVF